MLCNGSLMSEGGFIRPCSMTNADGDQATASKDLQGTASKDLAQVPIGPVTRARVKKFKDVLNGLIKEL